MCISDICLAKLLIRDGLTARAYLRLISPSLGGGHWDPDHRIRTNNGPIANRTAHRPDSSLFSAVFGISIFSALLKPGL